VLPWQHVGFSAQRESWIHFKLHQILEPGNPATLGAPLKWWPLVTAPKEQSPEICASVRPSVDPSLCCEQTPA
jgi:hypothetical protein